ncbi:hypothetical protein DSM112329_03676 [Paraconexibacter sp. AEG42_29]|uniref:HTH tetR-type domain-containing protein n=1 Tax=Paraconexibacter sp. AEG42_29 TaxID=2997339 RepID=A0AAU7AZQ3_9ACTN
MSAAADAGRAPHPKASAKKQRQVQERLLDAVDQLLIDGASYTELSVGRITKQAGMARSTFYVYFTDKGELLRATFADIAAEIEDAAVAWFAFGAGQDRDALRRALDPVIRTYNPHTTLMGAAYAAAAYDPLIRAEVERITARSIAGLRRHIRRGQAEGFVRADVLPGETATWLIWMTERCQHTILDRAEPDELDAMIDSYTDLVWEALYARV